MTVQHITKDEATTAITAAAFTVTDPEASDHGRVIIHCMMTFTGADWDLAEALKEIERADEIAWTDHLFGHDLAVRVGGDVYHFDAKRPIAAA